MTDDDPLLGNKTFSGVSSLNIEPHFSALFFNRCSLFLFLNLIQKWTLNKCKRNYTGILRETKNVYNFSISYDTITN